MTRPGWVPAGILRRSRFPPSVDDRHLRAEERLAERHREVAGEGRAVAGEDGVRPHGDDEDQVAGVRARAAALAAEADPAAALDPGRDRHLQAAAVHLDEARPAGRGVLEGDLDRGLDGRHARRAAGDPRAGGRRRRARRPVRRAGGGAGHPAGEEGAEEVGEAARVAGELEADAAGSRRARRSGRAEAREGAARPERVAARPAARAGVLLPVGAELVVLLPLGGVGEDLVGLVDLLEAALRLGVARVAVRVVLPGERAEGLPDLPGRGRARHAQDRRSSPCSPRRPPWPGSAQPPVAIAGGWSAGKPGGGAGTASGALFRGPPPDPGALTTSVFGFRRSAPSRTWSIESTRMSLICFRISSGMSWRSFSFFFGRITRRAPERCAARILLLRPPMGRTRPRRVISPVIATSLRTGMPVSALTMAVAIVIPADGPSLGMAPAGNVDVQGVLLEDLALDAEARGVGADPRERRAGRLLHDVAELAGEDEVLAALHLRDLDGDDVAPDLGDDEAGGGPGLVLGLQLAVLEARRAEELQELAVVDDGLALAPLGHPAGDLAHDVGELALQVPDAGLVRVRLDERDEGLVGDLDVLLGEPVVVELLREEEALPDLDLLELGVAGEPDDLHPVAQGRRDRVEEVGGRDEEHLREVEGHLQVVVLEGVVLLRVEDLEEGRRRDRPGSPSPACRPRRA